MKTKSLSSRKKTLKTRVIRKEDGIIENISNGSYIYLFRDSENNKYQFSEKPMINEDITDESREFCSNFTENDYGKKYVISAYTTKNNIPIPKSWKIKNYYYLYNPICKMKVI